MDLQLFRGQHLRFAYMPMRLDASEVLDTAIVVDGITYDPGDQVKSKIRLDQYELSFRSEFWLGDYVSIAPLLQVSLVDGVNRLRAVAFNSSGKVAQHRREAEGSARVSSEGVAARVDIPEHLQLTAEVRVDLRVGLRQDP